MMKKRLELAWKMVKILTKKCAAPMRPWRYAAIFFGFLAIAATMPARADSGVPPEDAARLRLVAAETAHGAEPFLAGVEMRLADGWKTYWRMPGDSGIAPRFDWSKSENVAAVDLRWPVPQRFDVPDDVTFGYRHEVVWPLLVTPKRADKPVKLVLAMSYGICSDICVPGMADLALALPAGTPLPSASAPLLAAWLARVPAPPANPEIIALDFEQTPKPLLNVRLKKADEVPQLIVEGPDGAWFGTPVARRRAHTVDYSVPVELDKGATLRGMDVTLTFAGEKTAIEVTRRVE